MLASSSWRGKQSMRAGGIPYLIPRISAAIFGQVESIASAITISPTSSGEMASLLALCVSLSSEIELLDEKASVVTKQKKRK